MQLISITNSVTRLGKFLKHLVTLITNHPTKILKKITANLQFRSIRGRSKGFVLLAIAAIVIANAVILSMPCWKQILTSKSKQIYDSDNLTLIARERNAIFLTAVMTSWIAPHTVWSNNVRFKSYFRLVSSFTTFVGYWIALAATFAVAKTLDFSRQQFPPVTHCFQFVKNASDR